MDKEREYWKGRFLSPEEIKELREYLIEHFHYNTEAGELIWKKPPKTKPYLLGKQAGTIDEDGYTKVRIKNRHYKLHKLLWLLEYGEWVTYPYEIDHDDVDPSNNRITNLKKVTRRENDQNKKIHKEGKLVGAYYLHSRSKWHSYIKYNQVRYHLGSFPTEYDAHLTYMNAVEAIKKCEAGETTEDELISLLKSSTNRLNSTSKDTWEEIEEDFDKGMTYKELFSKYNINYGTIKNHFYQKRKREEK